MNNIVPFPPQLTADRMRCIACDGTEFHLLASWQVQCAACRDVMDVIEWRFDVEVGECGEIHDGD